MDCSEEKKKKKLVIVNAILFLIEKFEKTFRGRLKNDDNEENDKTSNEITDEDDPDKAFLMSVLPDFKNLNDDEKLEFRLHTLQFFKNTRNGNKQQPYFSIQSPNHPMLSQYFLNYHSQQSSFPGIRENFPPSQYVNPYPYLAPTDNNQWIRQETIFRNDLSNTKHLDDYLLDLK